MALLLRDLSLDLPVDENCLPDEVARYLNVNVADLADLRVVRRSVDARKKGRVRKVFTLEFSCENEERLLEQCSGKRLEKLQLPPEEEVPRVNRPYHVLVVGMGPAGIFAAKRLVESGVRVTLVDRGRPIEQRVKDVERFWTSGEFDPVSNVQFGEGGAGTFSDGKLTTRLNHPRRMTVLKELVACGAPDSITVEARPHVGTDRLRKVMINFRKKLIAAGVDVRFENCLTDLVVENGRICGAVLNGSEQLECDGVILAPGHSARDTYSMLDNLGVELEPKSFAMGLRVEHPAHLINRIQYGKFAEQLPAADYTLRYNDAETGRGVYSFCMCPGGEVINAASEPGGVVVNGMSYTARDGAYSNSALVVSVTPQDWGGETLGGVHFQQRWERKAFAAGGKTFMAPAQNMMAFSGQGFGPVVTSCRPGVVEAELREVLPDFVYHGLLKALPTFERKMRGFVSSDAVLLGVETRTSAPLRIRRDECGESVSHKGLFPAGEGAGYAGGIMSAALDGLEVASRIVHALI